MKRLIYLTYLGLLAFILVACEKEALTPAKDEAAIPFTEAEAKKACAVYAYKENIRGVVNFGNARPDVLIIGFRNGLSLQRREQILSQYSAYQSIDGEFGMDSGILTIVNLKPGITCGNIAAMINHLETRPLVRFAAPTFDPDDPTVFKWLGLTNEVIVTMKNATSGPALQLLCRQTNTRIVAQFAPDTYLVSADKYSTGNALKISTLFNKSPKVYNAEPNLLFQLAPFIKKENTAARKFAAKRMELSEM
jgi:hypothetical protein